MATRKGFARTLLALAWMALAVAGCETTAPQDIVAPARLLYLQAEISENQGLFTEAIDKYTQLIAQYSGTRLATFSHLRLAEIYSRQEEWGDADTNYRLFLNLNSNSHLTPFLLYRLLKVNHERSFTGAVFKEREFDRDMEPNRNIILEYKRFFLLYPKSVYLDEVTPIFRSARETLGLHELVVADFYFERGQFNAAISRYLYLLRNFPEFKDTDEVLLKLVEAYQENQQQEFAKEIERIHAIRQKGGALTRAELEQSPALRAKTPPPNAPATSATQ